MSSKAFWDDLKGKYFYYESEDKLYYGEISGEPRPGYYLVRLYEKGLKNPCDRRLVNIDKMASWFFYESSKDRDLQIGLKEAVQRNNEFCSSD